MTKLTLCLAICLCNLLSHAQTSFTIIAGLHNATVSPNYLSYPDTVPKTSKKKIGAELGIMANFQLRKGFAIRSGILFSAKGANTTQYFDTTDLIRRTMNQPLNKQKLLYSANTVLNTNYVDIPLNLTYCVPADKKIRFIIGAGPTFSFLLSPYKELNTLAFSQSSFTSPTAHYQKEVIDLPLGSSAESIRIFHLGYNAFAGIVIGKISLTANYYKDLSIFFEEKGNEYKHETFGVVLGFDIGADAAKNKK